MNHRVFKPLAWMMAFVLIVSLACNFSSSKKTEEPAPKEKTPVEEPTEAPTAKSSGAVDNLKGVREAVIQIYSEGTFVKPEFGGEEVIVAGRGSGFFIDPSGIAVTNNHVVSGAALLKVWVGGNQDKTYDARVLGISECNDLAVIQIESDEDFPYLEWYEGEIEPGQDLYVAGFPLGEPEYALVKGIVSKIGAKGQTSWASLEKVLVYDAATNAGNSGGPVITPDGKVLGVHYRGDRSALQAFGVPRDIARPIIEKLRAEQDLEAIGVNGEVVWSEDDTLTGVWVSSVTSGSPASRAGLQGGDIITRLEDLVMGSDHTMADYCNVLRSHGDTDVISMEVLRYTENQVLEGELNGKELEIASQGSGTSDDGTGSAGGNPDASQSGEYYFSTDFNDVDNWYIVTVPKTEDYRAFSDNGVMYMEVSPSDITVYAFYDLTLNNSDVRVDTHAEKVAGPNTNNLSVVCRASNEGWYEFSMTSGGYWYIWLYHNGKYSQLAKGASYAINMKNQANQLTATCIGSQLTFYVNGTELGSATDRTLMGGGQVGVSIYSEYPDLGVEFDWFAALVP